MRRRQSGRSQRTLFLPPPLARLTARAAMLAARLSGGPPMLTLGKLPELYHRDWVSHAEGLDAVTGWRPHRRLCRRAGDNPRLVQARRMVASNPPGD